MQAKIYQPTKSAMQSGMGNVKKWLLEYESHKNDRFIENIMGWTASKDMTQEIKLSFASKEEAIKGAVEFMELHKKHLPGWVGETEVRQMMEPGDFPNCK